MRIITLLTLSFLLATNGVKAQDSFIGKRFTDVQSEDTADNLHRLSEYAGKGKWVLVDFWASWCGPCRAEMPNVVAAYEKYHDKGLEIVAYSFDRSPEAWKEAIDTWGMPWTHLIGQGEPGEVYNVQAIPDNLLIDPEGTIVARGLRGPALEEFLSQVIKQKPAPVCDENGCKLTDLLKLETPVAPPVAWVNHFKNGNEEVQRRGDVYLEYYPATDSMYVCVRADEQYDFGVISVQCLVPGKLVREGEKMGFAYDDNVQVVCLLDCDCQVKDADELLGLYRKLFSVSRIVPVASLKELEITSRSEDELVVEGRYEGEHTFRFQPTEKYPSRLAIWDKVQPQRDEILATANMSLDEFFGMFSNMMF